MESIINVRAVCKVCRGYPQSTGHEREGKFEHQCPTCGNVSLRDREYPYKRVVNQSTYTIFPNDSPVVPDEEE